MTLGPRLTLLAAVLLTTALAGCEPATPPNSQQDDPTVTTSDASTNNERFSPSADAHAGGDPSLMAPPPSRIGVESRLVDRPDEIITVLGNGMTVLVKRYPAAPVATVRMHVRAGSIWEDQYVGAGISHLFEHLLHGGTTERRTEAESRRLLEEMGAQTNAYTTYDQTVYFIDIPAEHAGGAIDLLADWVTRPKFPPDEVAREVGVVQRELERNLDNPDRQLWLKFDAVRYRVHPARFPVIGEQSAVAKLTRADILAYYRRMYVPSRVVFAVVGDLDPARTLATIKESFADFRAAPDAPIPLPAEPEVTSPRSVIYPMDVAQVRFLVGYPTIPLLHEDLYPLDVMMYVLAGGESSRLTVELRDKAKLALSIDAGSWTPSWGPGVFYFSGMCESGNWTKLRAGILAQAERLKNEKVSDEELARAKRVATVEYVRHKQTAASIGESMAGSLLSIGDAHFDDLYVRKLNEVTADQVQAAARKWFDNDKFLTTLIVPRDFTSSADTGDTAGAAKLEVSDIRKIRLDNGLTVLLRRNTAVPLVAIQAQFRGGLLGEPAGKTGISRLMALTALRGTRSHSAEQLHRAFESAGGTIGSVSGRNSFSFSASVLADKLDAMLPLFAEVVLNPTFPEAEASHFRDLTLAGIRQIDDHLDVSSQRFFYRRYFGNHPYAELPYGTADDVASITPDDLRAFHRRYVVGENAVLSIFGDIDLEEAEKLVRRNFAGMPIQPGFKLPEQPAPAPPAEDSVTIDPTKLSEAAQVNLGYPGVSYDDPDWYALTVLDTMISGYGLPGGWLHEELRGRKLVYEVHAVNLSWLNAGVFWIYAKCQPEKVAEVRKAIAEQIQRVHNGELTEKMLTNAKATVLASELMDNQTNSELAFRAGLDEVLGRGYDHYQRLSRRINAVSLEDVNRVAGKYLTHAVTTVTTAKPEAAGLPESAEPTNKTD